MVEHLRIIRAVFMEAAHAVDHRYRIWGQGQYGKEDAFRIGLAHCRTKSEGTTYTTDDNMAELLKQIYER
jgi:hypothetical protein